MLESHVALHINAHCCHFVLEVTHQSNTARIVTIARLFTTETEKACITGYTMDAIYRWSYLQFEALAKMALVGQLLEYSLGLLVCSQ